MELNYSRVTVGTVKLNGFSDRRSIWDEIPAYIPPDKTGDDLADQIAELQAYRGYMDTWNKVRSMKEAHMKMLEEIKAIHSIDIVENFSDIV